MKIYLAVLSAALLVAAVAVSPSSQAKSECMQKREAAEKLVKEQDVYKKSNLAIVVPNCNDDGSYATLQCHHGSNFCQCWDKEGIPQTAPKKNLQKCACLMDRAKALKSVPPSQTDIPEVTSCEVDGAYSAKQCNRSACWCVDPESGKKKTEENKDKNALKC